MTLLLTCCATANTALGYDQTNHEQMSILAVKASVLSSSDKLQRLGLTGAERFAVPGAVKPLDIPSALALGARKEDDLPRPANHFFNPRTNEPLTILSPFDRTSPDWALEDNGAVPTYIIATPQEYSYRHAQNYLVNALTAPTAQQRSQKWGMVLRSIGQVMHHVQDMAQPQHVRNDQHLELGIPSTEKKIGNPSVYEAWTRAWKTGLDFAAYPAYPSVYSPTATASFKTPRDFWTTSPNSIGTNGLGLAEFTNRNFFSMGTRAPDGSDAFPAPVAFAADGIPVSTLCENANPPCPPGLTEGVMGFYRSNVYDNLNPDKSQANPRALAHSIFDYDLVKRGLKPVATLNRFTYEAALEMLIPRAIAYSAGLLNFFFRGEMSIDLPDEGVYALVDHTTPEGSDKYNGGFRTLKLKVKNTTPGPNGIEPMGTSGRGTLRAIVKFHRNLCYQADLSGEYGSPGSDWRVCREAAESVIASAPVAAPVDIDAAAQTTTFAFLSPIPISATDVYLQVVYDGPLGQEPRAIAVATKDISEPTYAYAFDIHDQFTYARYPYVSVTGQESPYSWDQWCQQAISDGAVDSTQACGERLWPVRHAYQFSATGAPVAGWDPATSTLPQGEWLAFAQEPALNAAFVLFAPTGKFARVVYLTNTAPLSAVAVDDWNGPRQHLFNWRAGPLPAASNQLNGATNSLSPAPTWARARGIYMSQEAARLVGSPPAVDPLAASPSVINFPGATVPAENPM